MEQLSGAPGGLKMAVFFVRRQRSTKLEPAWLVWGGTTHTEAACLWISFSEGILISLVQ